MLLTALVGLHCRTGGALTAALTLGCSVILLILSDTLGWDAPYLTAVAGCVACYFGGARLEKSLPAGVFFPKTPS